MKRKMEQKSVYGMYYGSEFDEQSKNHSSNNGEFEHVIKYEDGIKSDFVLASSSVPVNYDYAKLNVEDPQITFCELYL